MSPDSRQVLENGSIAVMPGFVPAIHVLLQRRQDVDARRQAGHGQPKGANFFTKVGSQTFFLLTGNLT